MRGVTMWAKHGTQCLFSVLGGVLLLIALLADTGPEASFALGCGAVVCLICATAVVDLTDWKR